MMQGDLALCTQAHFVRLPVMCAYLAYSSPGTAELQQTRDLCWEASQTPRSMCCTEHLIRIDRLSVSITTRRLFAYSSYLLPNIDPAGSIGRDRILTGIDLQLPCLIFRHARGLTTRCCQCPSRELVSGIERSESDECCIAVVLMH